jgi:hypothetical protein
MKHKKFSLIFIFIILIIIFTSSSCDISTGDKLQRVKELESIFPILAKYKVQAYRNQDWCKNIYYGKGKFSNNNKQSTCNLFTGQAEEFNEQANIDFQIIGKALRTINLNILYFDIKYDENNNIKYAEFNIDCLKCSRDSFVYSFNYTNLPENQGKELQYLKINNNWYYLTEDWN